VSTPAQYLDTPLARGDARLVGKVILGQTEVDPHLVSTDITINYGRSSMDGAADSGSCEVVFLDDASHTIRNLIEVGKELEVWGGSYPIFRGHVSDIAVDFSTLDSSANIYVTAMGPLTQAGRIIVTTTGWPVETVRDRLERIERESGLTIHIQMIGNGATVQAEADGTSSVTTLLDQLCIDQGATVFDDPGGAYEGNLDLPARIVFQDIAYREQFGIQDLDPDRVILAPEWSKQLDIANVVFVSYRPTVDGEPVLIKDTQATSVTRYGRWEEQLDTNLTTQAAARTRAGQRIARRAIPFWAMHSCEYLRTYLSKIPIGQRLGLTHLPAGAPRSSWTPVVEGYKHTITATSCSTTFYLSDPRASYLTDKWAQIPQGKTWATINQSTEWANVVDVGDL
jgi:hypothetical protein